MKLKGTVNVPSAPNFPHVESLGLDDRDIVNLKCIKIESMFPFSINDRKLK